MPPPGDSRTREVGAVALAAGSAASGLVAYLYIALGTREFGAEGFSGVAQLWTIWFFGASVLTFPLQHWVIQRLRTDGHGGVVRAALPRLAAVTLGIGVGVSLVSLVLRHDLFGRGDLVYPVVAGAITVGAAVMGLLRGGLAGRSRFVATGVAIGSENVVRLAFGLAVVAAGASVDLYGAALATGVLIVLVWPGALRFTGPPGDHVSPLAFLGNVAGGSIVAQSILTGGPVVLSLTGGTRHEITSLFTALALFRAPYIVALGLAIRVTAALTDLATAGGHQRLTGIRRRIALVGLAAIAAGALGAAVVGPPLLRLVFGDDIDLSGAVCAALAAGSLAALANLGLTLVHMTDGSGRRILLAWVIALLAGAVTMLLAPLDPLPRVVAAFLASELAAFAHLALADETGDHRRR